MAFVHHETLKVPSPVSCISFGRLPAQILGVGSDDGTARFYELPSSKVIKAIRGFRHDISSIQWLNSPSESHGLGRIWLASGPNAYLFALPEAKLILSVTDASVCLTLGQDDEDVLNELSISDNRKYLAFSTDAGTIGVVDLADNQISRMTVSHTTICSSVKFIPDRPNELISGGYDYALLHFDFKQGTVLSRYDIAAAPPASGVSLSPPFILSVSMSPTGLAAATTADGRVWLGSGGDKSSPTAKKKRSRKWDGLRDADGLLHEVAPGPVVASAFVSASRLLTSTLLGRLALHEVSYDDDQMVLLDTKWTGNVVTLEKVNGISANNDWLTIGGFSKDGAGLVEVWKVTDEHILVGNISTLSVS